LPAVFDISRRRWVDPARATVDEVMAAVAKCPSGALQSAMVTAVHPSVSPSAPVQQASVDGVRVESTDPDTPVRITVQERDGLLVEGPFRVVDAVGNVIRTGDKCVLCRCGHSRTKPFCDSTHNTVDIDW
jgi:CDGSH-type Zn-finger protein